MAVVLVVDTGEDIIGVFSVAKNEYTAYRGSAMAEALALITAADELVTYNGNRYDLTQLETLATKCGIKFIFCGRHSDMQQICWPNILGSGLSGTYDRYFSEATLPAFPDTYEGSNELDTYMTFKLWELWQQGKLADLGGPIVPPRNAA